MKHCKKNKAKINYGCTEHTYTSEPTPALLENPTSAHRLQYDHL